MRKPHASARMFLLAIERAARQAREEDVAERERRRALVKYETWEPFGDHVTLGRCGGRVKPKRGAE